MISELNLLQIDENKEKLKLSNTKKINKSIIFNEISKIFFIFLILLIFYLLIIKNKYDTKKTIELKLNDNLKELKIMINNTIIQILKKNIKFFNVRNKLLL